MALTKKVSQTGITDILSVIPGILFTCVKTTAGTERIFGFVDLL